MMNRKRKQMAAGAGLLVTALLVGSFAYWSQISTAENPFDTGKYGDILTEDFIPEEDWQPGVDVNKDVYVKNTGDQDVIVRVKLDETWTYKTDALSDGGVTYKTVNAANKAVYTVDQDNATDGLTAADISVVTKHLSTSTNWIDGGDGYYYYKTNLEGGQSTDKWLDSVELLADADMGKFETIYYVSSSDDADPDDWTWFVYDETVGMPKYIDAAGNACEKGDAGAAQVLHNKTETKYVQDSVSGKFLQGYSQSDYKLTVTSETVQATQEAIDAMYGNGSSFTMPTNCAWTLRQ